MPRITVIIPCHNRDDHLQEAIDSVLHQTLADLELLVIDDSAAIVHRNPDPRVRLLQNEANLGIAATRNRGAAAADGDYVAFLDSDDIALPERLARQAAFLDAHGDYAAVGTWIEWIDDRGNRLGKTKRKPVTADQIRAERLFRSGLENSTVMVRTAVLRDYTHREDFTHGSDYDLWARVAADHKLATLPEVLVQRRRHGGQITAGKTRDKRREHRFEIFAAQLQSLGVAFDAADLERHYLLRRMHKEGFTPDAGYLDWAEAWLQGLRQANQTSRLYPEPAFSGLLGGFWLKACWNARARIGWRAMRRFLRSPLRRPAGRGVWHELRARLHPVWPLRAAA